jgi:rhodanese-related sulfurtransferase
MAKAIDTARARELLAAGAQALEVLPANAFDREHLPGARNIPLPELTRTAVEELDRDRPVVAYCYDTQCDLSARAASLLEAYGFSEVYDYTGSKAAWLALDLPYEGTTPDDLRAGKHVRPVATCAPSATIGEAMAGIDTTDGRPGLCIVVDDADVVLGTVRQEAAGAPADTAVLDVMHPGPASVRPSITIAELIESMDKEGQDHVLATTLDGRLLGVVRRDDLDIDA